MLNKGGLIMKFEFNEQQLNNLFVFLDRVEIKGLREIQAINEILGILHNPLNDENDKNDEK
jgi:hypothetical protein